MLSWEEPEDLARSWSRDSGDPLCRRSWGEKEPPAFVRIRAVKRVGQPRTGLRRHMSPRMAVLTCVLLGALGGAAVGSRVPEEVRPQLVEEVTYDDLDGLLERERRMILRGLWMMEALEGVPVF